MVKRGTGRLARLFSRPGFLVASAALIAILVAIGQRPPAALDEFVPEDHFSAERAIVILEALLAESQPHIAGSPLNGEIKSRIVQQFEAMGYQPEIQARFHCNPHFGSCANVENIIVAQPGSEGGHAVLVTAHYDSSWAGPGAADDGAGTASLIEIARMAAQYGKFRNDVIFLISDAEEQGLVGAHAFAEHHPLFSKIRAVINIEARGVSGPSVMFETGDGNRSMIRILSKSLERPAANSLAYEVYKRMPNDTDYSVYRNQGVMGVNFAFSEGVALYHTRLDDTAHLNPASVQHQGQNAWTMLTALADRDIGKLKSREDAAYVDIFSRVLVHYPISAASGITIVLTVLILLGIVLTHKKDFSFAGVFWAIFAQLTVLAVFVAGAWLLNWPLGFMVETNPIEHPNPWAARITVFSLCALAVWIGGKLYAHRISLGDGLLISWISFAALALLLDFRLPAASFLALLPLAAFFVGMLVDVFRWRSRGGLLFAGVFGFWMATYLAVYFFYQLATVISFSYTHLMAAPLILMLVAFLPMWFARFMEPFPDWRPAFVLLGLVMLAAIFHQFLPGFTDDRPRGMNLVYSQASAGSEGLVYLESPGGGVDIDYADIVGLAPMEVLPPYSSAAIPLNDDRKTVTRHAGTVASLMLPAPQVSATEVQEKTVIPAGGLANIRFTVVAPETSERIVIAFPRDTNIAIARVDGVLAIDGDLKNKRGSTPTFLALPYPGPEPITIEVSFKNSLPAGFNVSSREALPASLWDEYRPTWPSDAQAVFHGFRAEVVTSYLLSGD